MSFKYNSLAHGRLEVWKSLGYFLYLSSMRHYNQNWMLNPLCLVDHKLWTFYISICDFSADEVVMINVHRYVEAAWSHYDQCRQIRLRLHHIIRHRPLLQNCSPQSCVWRNLLSTPHRESHGFQENRTQHIEKSWLYHHSRMIVDKECFLPVSLRKLRWTCPSMN